MGRMLLLKIHPEETVVLRASLSSDEFNADAMKYFREAKDAIGTPFGVEMVWVLHNDQRTLMLVDEFGAVEAKEGYPLHVNPKATEIYHAASRRRGSDWDGPPHIHGDVVLFEDIQVE